MTLGYVSLRLLLFRYDTLRNVTLSYIMLQITFLREISRTVL